MIFRRQHTATALMLSALLSIPCVAQGNDTDNSVIIHAGAWSEHWGGMASNVTNESHNLIAVETHGYTAGFFENSYDRNTVYAGKVWRGNLSENVSASLSLGFSYGYRECYGDNGEDQSVCLHGYASIGYDIAEIGGMDIRPSIKVMPGVVVFSPEFVF